MTPEGLRESKDGSLLEIRVTPRSAREGVAGWGPDGRLRIRVQAPPVDGAANDAVIRLLAKRLSVPRSRIRIARGEASRSKTVELAGVRAVDVERALAG